MRQVEVLSGGERNRLNLALTLREGGNLGCAVVISHDR